MDESFVVGFRRDNLVRQRAIIRRKRNLGAALLTCAAIALGGALVLAQAFWPFGVIMVAGMLPFVIVASKAVTQSAKKRWYDATELPPYAMRMTPAALELGFEGAPAPVILPWAAVAGLRQHRRSVQLALEVVLQPGITSSSPGVSGLDQPAISSVRRTGRPLKTFGYFDVAFLDQSVEAIDRALRYFSGGRAGVLS